ncbi:MAG: hypothetical protein WC299_00155 [Kiritimatiellia bacterium]
MKPRLICSFAIPVVCFIVSNSLGAAEYFVNKQGSDGNDGLARNKAFLTVHKGLNAIAPGDALTIGPGEYFEAAFRTNLGGSAKATIVRAEINGTVILRGDIPAPTPRAVEGCKYIYAFNLTNKVQCVNEVDTLTMYSVMPSIEELEFVPGSYYFDEEKQTVYFSTSDWLPPARHRLTVSVINNSGLLLYHPTNVIIEGLAACGFNKDCQEVRAGDLYGSRAGIGIDRGADNVIRHCTAFLNGTGIAIQSSKNCLVEHCVSYGNYTKFGSVSGNICNWNTPEEGGIIRHCKAFGSHLNGIDFYGEIKGVCRLEDNITWHNISCDMKIKGGACRMGFMERCVASEFYIQYTTNIFNSLCTRAKSENPQENNIVFAEIPGLVPGDEFADPENLDYRLQAASRFRGAAGGRDEGLYPYKPDIYYVKTNGSDSADGLSVSNAWLSLDKALGKLRAGDTLYILSGVYAGGLKIEVSGKPGHPVKIAGRGNERVVISGLVELKKTAHMNIERLNFTGGGVNVNGGENIRVSNCGFNVPLVASKADGFVLEHSALTRGVELKSCKGVITRDNIFDNQENYSITLDGPLDGYIAWNCFSNPEKCRSTAGKVTGLGEEQYSSALRPEFTDPVKGVFTLRNDHLFNGYGSLGMPLGPYRRVRAVKALKIVDPQVLAVSATTADIEWRTTGESTTELSWGETPACTNRKELIYWPGYFHTMSLAGLKPGTKYYFKASATMPGYELHGNPEAEALDLKKTRARFSSGPGELTTLDKSPAPATYYVSTSGCDSSSGLSTDEAWRTISHAARRAGPGDMVIIGGGAYGETVRFRRTGDYGLPVRFTCAPGEKVWLDGRRLALCQGINIFGKEHVHLDGLYARDYGSGESGGGIVNVNGGSGIQITRFFHDGRTFGYYGYTPGFINAASSSNLLVKNCFCTRGFRGPHFWSCAGLRVENNVFFINQIGMMFMLGKPADVFSFDRNIFADNIIGKSLQPLLLISAPDQMLPGTNCFYLRNSEKDRKMIRLGDEAMTWGDYKKLSGNRSEIIFANPRFTALRELVTFSGEADWRKTIVVKSKELAAEHAPDKPWDFKDFFAQNPDLVKRGIGLQPEAFKDYQFITSTTNVPGR